MRKFLFLRLIATGLLLMGCGQGVTAGGCNQEVIGDYNEVVIACSVEQDGDCTSTADSFLSLYPGVDCSAQRNPSDSVRDESFQVTEDLIRQTAEGDNPGGFAFSLAENLDPNSTDFASSQQQSISENNSDSFGISIQH